MRYGQWDMILAGGSAKQAAAGGFPPLPQPPRPGGAGAPKVCVVSFDVVGPVRCGGVGTAFTSLATLLARAGHDVTVLYMHGERCEESTIGHWVRRYAEEGIRLVPLPPAPVELTSVCTDRLAASYRAYLWLVQQEFDVVHFSDWRAPGFCSLTARRQGLAFARTTLCVHTHGPSMWSMESNSGYLGDVEEAVTAFMERRSVELADVVVSPSRYMLRWIEAQGWQLPARCFVQPYVQPQGARRQAVEQGPDRAPRPVEEIVFFGRLEPRKGIELFCDALDLLAGRTEARPCVTFLGKAAMVGRLRSRHYLRRRARRWPFRWRAITGYGQPQALDYLAAPGRLAVMPSLVDNLPLAVLECLGGAVPFISTEVGGIPEMIAEADRPRTLVPLDPARLAERLDEVLREGAAPARMAVDQQENDRAWVAWHEGLPRAADTAPEPEPPVGDLPLVSVCIPTHNRAALLRRALESVEALDYANLEVLVVDDGSTDSDALALLGEIERSFPARGWQVLRQENKFPCAARNNAARHARGEYLMLMDDDNCARPQEVFTFVRAARACGADIVTCYRDDFTGRRPPGPDRPPLQRVLYPGAAAAAGLFANVYGDTNCLVRREVYLTLGGMTEDYGLGFEDWEFFARAVLAGYRLEVVPEALYDYLLSETGVDRLTPRAQNLLRVARAYRQAVPAPLRDMILLAQGAILQGGRNTLVDYRTLPGLHLLRVGLLNCWRQGPRGMLSDVRRKLRKLFGG